MSLHVTAAGSSSVPRPSRLTPTSLTTILAPSLAIDSANSRPMPRPDPVMTATRPSSIPIAWVASGGGGRGAGEHLDAVLVGGDELEVDELLAALFALAHDLGAEREGVTRP